MTTYRLKPAFQRLLKPTAALLCRYRISPDVITLAAVLGSVAIGGGLVLGSGNSALFLLLPVWLLIRMAMNALDGMIAVKQGRQSAFGAYLNELADIVSDAALIVPFAFVEPFQPAWVVATIMLAVVSEFAGVLGPSVGARRRYEGPMGKSDRALAFSALALCVALLPSPPLWLGLAMPCLSILLVFTVVNRVRAGLAELSVQAAAPLASTPSTVSHRGGAK